MVLQHVSPKKKQQRRSNGTTAALNSFRLLSIMGSLVIYPFIRQESPAVYQVVVVAKLVERSLTLHVLAMMPCRLQADRLRAWSD